jgi:hypothetical protein
MTEPPAAGMRSFGAVAFSIPLATSAALFLVTTAYFELPLKPWLLISAVLCALWYRLLWEEVRLRAGDDVLKIGTLLRLVFGVSCLLLGIWLAVRDDMRMGAALFLLGAIWLAIAGLRWRRSQPRL